MNARVAAFAVAVAISCAAAPAAGQDADTQTFLTVEIKPWKGTYLVLKDANVRALPLTKGRRLGRLEEGSRVEVVGRANGPWLAVRQAGKDYGFVYEQIMMPIIDGRLEAALDGTLTSGSRECRYAVRFTGKSAAQGQLFEFADYEVEWRCRQGELKAAFATPMFLTEGPYQGRSKPVHQVTVDIMEMEAGLEEIFSTNLLGDRGKARLRERLEIVRDGAAR